MYTIKHASLQTPAVTTTAVSCWLVQSKGMKAGKQLQVALHYSNMVRSAAQC
jgi:hypothetical protein